MGAKPLVRVHFAGATSEPQEAALVPYRGARRGLTAATPVDTRALMELLGAPKPQGYGRRFETPERTYDASFGAQSLTRPPSRTVAGVCLCDNGSPEGLTALREHAFLALHTGVFRSGRARGVLVCLDGCGGLDASALDARERAVRAALVEAGLPGDEVPAVHLDVARALAREPRWVSAIEALAEALDEHVPPVEVVDEPFCMPIEDTFVIRGRGTVVTGQIARGVVRVGAELDLIGPNGRAITRVNGIEMVRRLIDEARAPDVVGLLLRDVARENASRGAVLAASGTFAPVSAAPVRLARLTKPADGAPSSACRAPRGVEFADVTLEGADDACVLRSGEVIPWELGAPLPLYRQGSGRVGALEGLAFVREL